MDAATQMAADGLQAFGMIGTVLWTMLRIGAVAMAMPMVGTRAVPARIRVILAGTLAIALAPLLPPVPDWTGFDAATVLTIARELAIGVSIGFLLRLVFEAGAMAGELIAQGTGLAFAQMSDPLRGALTLAIPLTVAMLAVNLAFGVLARAAPALNPIQLGLPVSLLLGLFLLALLAGEMGPPVQRLFDAAFQAADAVTH